MGVDSKHPDYADAKAQWDEVRDANDGAYKVKDQGEIYLPKPTGFKSYSDGGDAAYAAYKLRAQFPQIFEPTVRGMNGVINRTEAQIELPVELEPLFERATADGLTLEALHRLITVEVLKTGRMGLLADISEQASSTDLPYLATYTAESIINWSKNSDFFVLDETDLVRHNFEWVSTPKFRSLTLGDDGNYVVTTYDAGDQIDGNEILPRARGGKTLQEIPFVVIGSTGVRPDIDEIPLYGVALCAYAIYRLDADYRHQLFSSGQETLFCSGLSEREKPTIIGAGVVICLPENGKAEYVGPKGTGIAAHRTAIQDERQNAVLAGARLFEQTQKSAESGDALRIRFAAQTATLTSIAQAAAQGLERALRYCATFVGADPDKVVVKPNLSFIDSTMTPSEALNLVKVWQAGGISFETLYDNLQRGEIASAERTADEEQQLIEDEMPQGGLDPSFDLGGPQLDQQDNPLPNTDGGAPQNQPTQ